MTNSFTNAVSSETLKCFLTENIYKYLKNLYPLQILSSSGYC